MSVERARALRKTMTPQEVKLWVRLRELRGLGHHPRRQAPIDRYVVDFAFRRAGLVIEIDGGQHGEEPGMIRDRVRDARLGALGYRVLRFWNVDVNRNLDGVVETVLAALEEVAPYPSPGEVRVRGVRRSERSKSETFELDKGEGGPA